MTTLFEKVCAHQTEPFQYDDAGEFYADFVWRAINCPRQVDPGYSIFTYALGQMNDYLDRAAARNPESTCFVMVFEGLDEKSSPCYGHLGEIFGQACDCSFATAVFSRPENTCPRRENYDEIWKSDGTDGVAIMTFITLKWIEALILGTDLADPPYIPREDNDHQFFYEWMGEQFGYEAMQAIGAGAYKVQSALHNMNEPVFWYNFANGLCDYYENEGFTCECFESIYDIEHLLVEDQARTGMIAWPDLKGVTVYW